MSSPGAGESPEVTLGDIFLYHPTGRKRGALAVAARHRPYVGLGTNINPGTASTLWEKQSSEDAHDIYKLFGGV